MSAATRFRAAVVGCGRIGCAFDDDPGRGSVSSHAGAYVRTPGVELVALADIDAAKVEKYGEKFGVRGRYTDAGEMFRHERPDIVSVCTPSSFHLEIVREAVQHGVKAVFCEKPIADSLGAADEIVDLCRKRGVLLMVDHQRRFDEVHQRIAAFVREGGLGRVEQVTCYYTAGVANTGSHVFDLLRFILGDPSWVQGRHSRNVSPDPRDPNIDGWLSFKCGTLAAVQACDVDSYLIFEVSILGTRGRIRLMSSGFRVEFEEVRPSERFTGYRELVPAPAPFPIPAGHEFMLAGVSHLLDCLTSGRPPLSSGEDGRAALEVICALHDSAGAHSRQVDLPLATSDVIIHSR